MLFKAPPPFKDFEMEFNIFCPFGTYADLEGYIWSMGEGGWEKGEKGGGKGDENNKENNKFYLKHSSIIQLCCLIVK